MIILVGCTDPLPPNPGEVGGDYKGNFKTTRDDVSLHRDGAFDQIRTWNGKTFQAKGNWHIQGLGHIFSALYVPPEFNGRGEPVKIENTEAVWVNEREGFRRLAFDIDSGYFLDRTGN